jgi:predicted NUDIX family phosphoesterase
MQQQTKENLRAAALVALVIAAAALTPPQHLRWTLGTISALLAVTAIVVFTSARRAWDQNERLVAAMEDDPYATANVPAPVARHPLRPASDGFAYGQDVRKKHPQFILAMHASFFDGCPHFPGEINRLPARTFLEWPETQSALVIKERNALEPDGDYRQLLPYLVARQVGRDGETRVLAYVRGKAIGESRLVGKASVGFGGHVDLADVDQDESVIDLRATLTIASHREKHEELVLPFGQSWRDARTSFGDLFITHNEGVQRMHLGIVQYLDIPAEWEGLSCKEAELTTIGFRTPAELLAAHHNGEIDLEVWSRLVLERMLSDELQDAARGSLPV